jgi:glutathione S-transferase
MILVGGFGSPFVRRIATTLQLYDIAHEHRPLRGTDPDERILLKAINPLARVPALITDDAGTLVDSATILDYLDRRVGAEKASIPASGAGRTRVMALIGLAIGAIDKSVAAYYERGKRPEEKWHYPWLEQLLEQSKDGFEALEAEAADPWLTGSNMTQADISTVVFWDFAVHNRPTDAPALDCPKLAALSKRANALPQFSATRPPGYSQP